MCQFFIKIISKVLVLLWIINFVLFCNPVLAFNEQINYQGKLTNTSGVAVADGTYQMVFKLYTVATSGAAIWTETLSGLNEVTVTDGLFSVMLGSTTALTGVNFNQTLYLGVTIESDSEMTPRKILGAVPAAFEANNANTVGGVASTSFVRSDEADSITTSTAGTLLTITQNGAGNILDLFDGASSAFVVRDGGNVGIGTSSPNSRLTVSGNTYISGNLTATGTLSVGTLSGLLLGTSGTVSAISTSTLGIAISDTTGTLAVSRGGTGVTSFGGTNRILYTTAADTLVSEAAFTYDQSTDTLTAVNLSVGTTLSFSGVGALNGLDSIDGTTEATIETQVFDAEAETITGNWEVQDDVDFTFGNDADWNIQYDEAVDDQLLFVTTGTTASAVTDPLMEILVGTTPTADQQVFGIAKGTQSSNTALFTVDEDGDGIFTGTINTTGGLVIDATTETNIESAIDTLSSLTAASTLATIGTITSGIWNGTDIDISDYTNLGVTATGLTLSGDNVALTAGYSIPLTASTTDWNNSLSSSHVAVTLAGEDYLSLATQQITANAIDPDNLSASDFGSFSCNGTTCTLDSSAVDVSTHTNLSVSATGLALSGDDVVLSGGYNIPLTASTTAWNNFTATPSTVITAGNHIDWTSNTLDVVTTGDWTGTFDGQEGSFYRDASNLNAGTIPSARLSGSYSSITALGTLTSLAVSGNASIVGTTTMATTTMASTTIGTLSLTNALPITSGGTGANNAGSARTNLGATTVGSNLFTLANPSAVRFIQINSDNSVSTVATSSLGLITNIGPATQLQSGSSITLATSTGSFNGLTLGTTITATGNTITYVPSITGTLSNAGLANSTIAFATGTTGTDINWSASPVSLGGTATLNIPTASASARGLLSSTDWTFFNNKISSTSLDTISELDSLITDISGSTGTGALVLSAAPTFTGITNFADIIGTNATITNATTTNLRATNLSLVNALPVSSGGTGITAFGTGVAAALGINVGTAGAFITNGGALGTPSSGTLTNATGLPIVGGTTGTLSVARGGTGVTSFGGANTILYTTSADILAPITTGNNGVLITSAGGVPSISSTLPSAVQANITALGTLTSLAVSGNASIVGTTTMATTTMASTTINGNLTITGTVDGKDIDANAGMLNEAETISADWINTTNPWADNEVADILTISGGTINSNTISSGAVWTTAGTLTIGDGGDRIDVSSNTWDVTNGVITNATWNGAAIGDAYLTKSGDWTGTLDSIEGASLLRSDTSDSYTSGTLTFDAATSLDLNTTNLSIADTDIVFDGATTNFNVTGNLSINTDDIFVEKATGAVGIGTSAVGGKLEVLSNSADNLPALMVDGGGDAVNEYVGYLLGRSASFPSTVLRLASNRTSSAAYNFIEAIQDEDGAPTTAFIVRGDGNVGIGTTSPSQMLTVGNDNQFTVTSAGAVDATSLTLDTQLAVAEGGTGAITLTGLIQGNGTSAFTVITNSSTVGQVLRVTGASTYAWGALDLADTDAVTGTLADANVVDALTISGGTINSNTISSGAVWTTAGTLTIGDGGDRIDVSSNTWDVTNGVITNATWNGNALGISYGGLGAAFTDPNADQLMFFDDSAGTITGITSISGAAISGTTLTINDVTCTDCLGTTEIADSYVLNVGDTMTGGLTIEQNTSDHLILQNQTTNDAFAGGTMMTIQNSSVSTLNEYLTFIADYDADASGPYQFGTLGFGSNNSFTIMNEAGGAVALQPTSGNVGIGTTSPSQMLTVGNDNQFTVTSAGAVDATSLTLDTQLAVAEGGTGATTFTNNRLLTGNGTNAIVDEANLTFDGSTLTVTGAGSFSSTLTMSGSTANIALGSNYLSGDGDDEGIIVDSSGKVGIGDPTPDARFHVHETTALGSTLGNSQIIERISGSASSNVFMRNTWLYRDADGSSWTTARLHDGISVDTSFLTPGTDTKVWWERDPNNLLQSWGTAATTWMTINGTGLSVTGIGTFSSTLTADATLDANGVVTLGDNSDNITIDSNVWDISSAGVVSGLTGLTTTGTLDAVTGDFSSTLTMSGATANIALGSNYLSGDGADEGVFVDSLGNVGIGRASGLLHKLTIASTSSSIDGIFIQDPTAATYGAIFMYDDPASRAIFGVRSAGVDLNAIAIARDTGVTDFAYNSNFAAGVDLTGTASNITLGSNYLSGDGADEGIFVDSDGEVGIGTTTPTVPLHVRGNGAISLSLGVEVVALFSRNLLASSNAYASVLSGSTGIAGVTLGDGDSYTQGGIIYDNSLERLGLFANGGERLSILGSDVGIGTTSPTYRLDVNDAPGADYVARIWNTSTTDGADGLLIRVDDSSPTTNNLYVNFQRDAGTQIGKIEGNAGNLNYNTTSDIRLKENIAPSSYGLEDVLSIEVADYNFKAFPEFEQNGFLAQQLYEVYPFAVSKPAPNAPEGENIWGVDYGKLTPLLVQSLQDQHNSLMELLTNGVIDTNSSLFEMLQDDQVDTVWERIVVLVEDFADGMIELTGFKSDVIETEKLCIGDTCVTEQELINLLQTQNQDTNEGDLTNNEETVTDIVEEDIDNEIIIDDQVPSETETETENQTQEEGDSNTVI